MHLVQFSFAEISMALSIQLKTTITCNLLQSECQAEINKAFICCSGNGMKGKKISNASWWLLKLNRCEKYKSPIIFYYEDVTEAVCLPQSRASTQQVQPHIHWVPGRASEVYSERTTCSQGSWLLKASVTLKYCWSWVSVEERDGLHSCSGPQVPISNMLSL